MRHASCGYKRGGSSSRIKSQAQFRSFSQQLQDHLLPPTTTYYQSTTMSLREMHREEYDALMSDPFASGVMKQIAKNDCLEDYRSKITAAIENIEIVQEQLAPWRPDAAKQLSAILEALKRPVMTSVPEGVIEDEDQDEEDEEKDKDEDGSALMSLRKKRRMARVIVDSESES